MPFGFGEVEPHEDADGDREGAVDEAGFETECEEHGGSGIAMKV